jgi:hypothetical protein
MAGHIARVHVVVASIACCVGLAPALAGPLNPPAGPVESTNKPLGEVEPRTALTSANTPGDLTSRFIITVSGSYYMLSSNTGPLVLNHIEIAPSATNVTIDLMGQTLTVASFRAVITAPAAPAARTIVIRNGALRGSGAASGIVIESDATVVIEDVRFETLARPIDVAGAATVRRCDFRDCTLSGIAGVVDGAAIDVGNNSIVEDCRVENATGSGVNACVRVGSNSVVRNCVLTQISGGEVGISAGNTCIIENNIFRNDADATNFTGIQISAAGIIRDNLFTSTVAGTHIGIACGSVTTVTDNVFSSFDTGVFLNTASDCLVIRNHFRAASTAIDATFPASNIIGPLITAGGAAASNNPHANYSN